MKKVDCTVIGDAMIDIVLPLPHIPDVGVLSKGGVTNTRMVMSPGGSANVAFYISKLGGRAAFTGKVGDDYFGRMFVGDLREHGVTASVSVLPQFT